VKNTESGILGRKTRDKHCKELANSPESIMERLESIICAAVFVLQGMIEQKLQGRKQTMARTISAEMVWEAAGRRRQR
jgi:hypothetical protein